MLVKVHCSGARTPQTPTDKCSPAEILLIPYMTHILKLTERMKDFQHSLEQYYTVSQKVPTFKFSATLSNLNGFSKCLR